MKRSFLVIPVLASAFVLGTVLVRPTGVGADQAAGEKTISQANVWVGRRPDISDLQGHVVLVDVFTFGCSNCENITPNLRKLRHAYSPSQLVIVGVHTPEFPAYESGSAFVSRQANNDGLGWPIAVDDDHRIWNAFAITAWPTQLIFDKDGQLAATIVGDQSDDQVNAAIRKLIGS